MILSTSRLTCGVSTATSHALVSILGADEVWQGERVLRGIGRHAATADTAVCQSVDIAGVLFSRRGRAGKLEAEERACGGLALAPAALCYIGHGFWVDGVHDL